MRARSVAGSLHQILVSRLRKGTQSFYSVTFQPCPEFIKMASKRGGPSRRLPGRRVLRSVGDLPTSDDPMDMSSEFETLVGKPMNKFSTDELP